MPIPSADGARNKLLASLSPAVLARLKPRAERMRFADTLFQHDDAAVDAFFPHAGSVISLIRGSSDGSEVEVGLVGGDGFADVHTLLASPTHRVQAVVQATGFVSRVSLERLRQVLSDDGVTRARLLAWVSTHLEMVTQNALCNATHGVEERLCKWLLIMRSRVGADTLTLTHEFLAHMLGVRRSGVTVAVGMLTDLGLIEHARNRIVITKPSAVEARSCGCYDEISRATAKFITGLGS
jgi:CRP-like cAMP-binding protein